MKASTNDRKINSVIMFENMQKFTNKMVQNDGDPKEIRETNDDKLAFTTKIEIKTRIWRCHFREFAVLRFVDDDCW